MNPLVKELKYQIEEVGHDSSDVQLESILDFMSELGYSVANDGVGGFILTAADDYSSANRKFMSFQDAQRLHNGVPARVIEDVFVDVLFGYHLHFSYKVYQKALMAKLVIKTSLSRIKACNSESGNVEFIAHSNFVQII